MNIRLKDVALTLEAGGFDDGDGGFTGTGTTICVNSFSFDADDGNVDVSCGQDSIKHYRTGKADFTCEFEGNIPTDGLMSGTLIEQAFHQQLYQIKISLGDGILTVTGIRGHFAISGGDVPTWKLSLQPYGVVPDLA